MKKLFIALFAFVAVFAVAGSASAVEYFTGDIVPPHYSVMYNAYDGDYSVAFMSNNNLNLIWTTDMLSSTDSDLGVVIGINRILGLANLVGNDTRFLVTYLTNTNDLYELTYDIDTGIVSNTLINSTIDCPCAVASSSFNNHSVLTTTTSNDSTDQKLIYFEDSVWQLEDTGSSVNGPVDIYLSGSKVYLMSSDNGTIAQGLYDFSKRLFTHALVVSLSTNPSSIVITNIDDNSAEGIFQEKNDNERDYNFFVMDYTGGGYSINMLSHIIPISSFPFWDAAKGMIEGTIFFIYVDPNDGVLKKEVINISDGSFSSKNTISIVENINDVYVSADDNQVVTFTTSDISDQIVLRSLNVDWGIILGQQQDNGGGAIPELPGNTLWKVLLALLSLGLVVGIAAFMKKKKK